MLLCCDLFVGSQGPSIHCNRGETCSCSFQFMLLPSPRSISILCLREMLAQSCPFCDRSGHSPLLEKASRRSFCESPKYMFLFGCISYNLDVGLDVGSARMILGWCPAGTGSFWAPQCPRRPSWMQPPMAPGTTSGEDIGIAKRS